MQKFAKLTMAPAAGAVGLLAVLASFVAPSAALLGAARGQFSAGKRRLQRKASRFCESRGGGPPREPPFRGARARETVHVHLFGFEQRASKTPRRWGKGDVRSTRRGNLALSFGLPKAERRLDTVEKCHCSVSFL